MEKVIFKQGVLNYFDDLVYVLFAKDYFSYPENALNYVDKIVEFTMHEIASFPHKTTPIKLKNLGSNYIFYNANSRTTWFIFFERENNNYLITGILNNHCEEVKDL